VTRVRKLSRPPIKEALVDIQLPQMLPENVIEQIEALKIEEFVRLDAILQVQDQVTIAAATPPVHATSSERIGVRFRSRDGSKILQLRRNGVGCSIAGKYYSSWDDLTSLARFAWNQFLKVSGNGMVAWIITRYVNLIEIPPGIDTEDYLATGPRVPADLPQVIGPFISRVNVPILDGRGHIVVSQLANNPTPSSYPVVLDVEVRFQCALPVTSPEIWNCLDRLRHFKNAAFFSALTERAVEAYE